MLGGAELSSRPGRFTSNEKTHERFRYEASWILVGRDMMRKIEIHVTTGNRTLGIQ
jgi:hypothetical protein